MDIKNLDLPGDLVELFEKMSLNHAISQMDDLGWCPIPGCESLASLERDLNQGRCQHCDFTFCLGCKDRYHPFKRCLLHRLDLFDHLKELEGIDDIQERNKKAEQALNILFLKYCAKPCPNDKCGLYYQLMRDSECTHCQCVKCHTQFCWVCGGVAKGQKHFKERPQCKELAGSFLPEQVTQELKDKHMGANSDYINLKFCAKCPHCEEINEKKTKVNSLECKKCGQIFCYICNKPNAAGMSHYQGAKSTCHYESEHWCDL
jgi:hypothetical protein